MDDRVTLGGSWEALAAALVDERTLRVPGLRAAEGARVVVTLELPSGIHVDMGGRVRRGVVEVDVEKQRDLSLLAAMVEAEVAAAAPPPPPRARARAAAPPAAAPAAAPVAATPAAVAPVASAGAPRDKERTTTKRLRKKRTTGAAAPDALGGAVVVEGLEIQIDGPAPRVAKQDRSIALGPADDEVLATLEAPDSAHGAHAGDHGGDDFDIDLGSIDAAMGDALELVRQSVAAQAPAPAPAPARPAPPPAPARAPAPRAAAPPAAPARGPAPLDLGLGAPLAPLALDLGPASGATPAPLDLGLGPPVAAPASVLAAPPPVVAPLPLAAPPAARPAVAPPTPATVIAVDPARPLLELIAQRARSPEPAFDAPSGGPIVGIDYGTTYSSIAVIRNGHARVAADAQGRLTVPSIVHIGARNAVLAGWDARERLAADPGRTITSVKRLLGRRADDPDVASWLSSQPFRTQTLGGGAIALEVGGHTLSIPQISAEILRTLKLRAETALGAPVTDAVIAVPVAWESAQRLALRQAAGFAGLRVVGLVPEPLAAAMAHGLGRGRREVVCVFDFGGGTFDLALLEATGERFRVLALGGEPWLGGDDFDLALAAEAASDFFAERKVQLQNRAVEWQRLVWACEEGKRRLTDAPETTIELAEAAQAAKGPVDLRVTVNRRRFDHLGRRFVEHAMGVVEQGLEAARLAPGDVHRVILAGGMSRAPIVRDAVTALFGAAVVAPAGSPTVGPDETVALGAVLLGAAEAAPKAQGRPRT